MPVDAPVTRSRASAMGNLLTTPDAALVEVEPAHGAIAALELDELPVVPRSEPALGNDATHARILHSEGAGAPEPVGVPPPQIVPNGQMVDATPLDRAIVDVHAGVVAGGGRLVCERAERQIELVGAEDRAVEKVHGIALEGSPRAQLRHRGQAGCRLPEANVV